MLALLVYSFQVFNSVVEHKHIAEEVIGQKDKCVHPS